MTAINHALTGATIGLLVGDPWVALPAAFLSHFVCDALPHFGGDGDDSRRWIGSRTFQTMLMVDATLCLILVMVLAVLHPHDWFQASVCAFLATSPDLFWINRFLKIRHKKPWRSNIYSKFASGIQWFQRPIGVVVEVIWAAGAIVTLSAIIK